MLTVRRSYLQTYSLTETTYAITKVSLLSYYEFMIMDMYIYLLLSLLSTSSMFDKQPHTCIHTLSAHLALSFLKARATRVIP